MYIIFISSLYSNERCGRRGRQKLSFRFGIISHSFSSSGWGTLELDFLLRKLGAELILCIFLRSKFKGEVGFRNKSLDILLIINYWVQGSLFEMHVPLEKAEELVFGKWSHSFEKEWRTSRNVALLIFLGENDLLVLHWDAVVLNHSHEDSSNVSSIILSIVKPKEESNQE